MLQPDAVWRGGIGHVMVDGVAAAVRICATPGLAVRLSQADVAGQASLVQVFVEYWLPAGAYDMWVTDTAEQTRRCVLHVLPERVLSNGYGIGADLVDG